MILEVPFYFNSGHECGQVSLLSCLKHKFPNLDLSVENLNDLTYHKADRLTLPVQLAAGLSRLGVAFTYYAKELPFENVRTGLSKLIKDFYSPFGENLLAHMDSDAVQQSILDLKDSPCVSIKEGLSSDDIESILNKGNALSSLVNMDLFFGRENHFSGHYFTLTGFDNSNFFFHNSGPRKHGKNLAIDKNTYNLIRDVSFMDWGLISV